MESLKRRYRYSFILLKQLIKTDFKLRYQGSVLGYLWSLLKPLAIFAILYVVFVRFIGIGQNIPFFAVYLLLGIVLWNYFAEVTNGSVGAIVGRGDLLRKINFPRYVIIFAGSFSALINLFFNFVVVGLFMVLSKVDLLSTSFLILPLILELFAFSLAMAFFLSAAFVRFRDVTYIWEVVMQGAFYATPILYPLNAVPVSAAKLLILNPMAQMIQDARYVLVTHETLTIDKLYGNHWMRLIPVGTTIVLAVVSALYFRRRSRYFAEDV